MTTSARRDTQLRGSTFFLQRVPRHSGRADRPLLALNDGGHGAAAASTNPTVFGLGVRAILELNPSVRTWSVTVTVAGVTEDITSQFVADPTVARRYSIEGSLGTFPFGVEGSVVDYSSAKTLVFRVRTTNVNRTADERYEVVIVEDPAIKHCAAAEDCDFDMLGCLNKNSVRIYDDITRREISSPVIFLLDTLDKLITATGGVAGCLVPNLPGYNASYVVGVEFAWGARCGYPTTPHTLACETLDCCCYVGTPTFTYKNQSEGNRTLVVGEEVLVGQTLQVRVDIPLIGSGCGPISDIAIEWPGWLNTSGMFGFSSVAFEPVVLVDLQSVALESPTLELVEGYTDERYGATSRLASPVNCGTVLTLFFGLIAGADTGEFDSVPVERSLGSIGITGLSSACVIDSELTMDAFPIVTEYTSQPSPTGPPEESPSTPDIPIDVPPPNDKSVPFDGGSPGARVLTLGTSLELNDSEFSMALWINTSETTEQYLWSKSDEGTDNSDSQFALSLEADGEVTFRAIESSSGIEISTTTQINDGDWHHVVVVYDGVLTRIWIDGVASATTDLITAFNTGTGAENVIGGLGSATPSTYSDEFTGFIDEAAMWNVALTASDIASLYNSGVPTALDEDFGGYANASNLTNWWRMGDTDGDAAAGTVTDVVSGDDATIVDGDSPFPFSDEVAF